MHRTCIAVVDASRARLFTHERALDADGLRDELIERADLVDPARRLRPSQLFSSTGPADDHRDAHVDKLDAEFARDVTRAITSQLAEFPARHLIVCASPHMLGALRETLDGLRKPTLEIKEIPRDLAKCTPSQLREHLESDGLLPPRHAA